MNPNIQPLKGASSAPAGRFVASIARLTALGMAPLLALMSLAASAQTARSIDDEYANAIKHAQTVATLGDDLFGEQVSLKDGVTSFSATDVTVKTNSGLPMSVGRTLSVTAKDLDSYGDYVHDGELFGNWVLDVPYMSGTFDERTGWVSQMPNPQQRCSATELGLMSPPTVKSAYTNWNKYYEATKYWSGNRVHIPGRGGSPVLFLPATSSRPNDGRSYYAATKDNWRVACLSSLQKGIGEGFLVVLPDGTRYTFDWMTSRKASDLQDTECLVNYGCGTQTVVNRREYFLYATRVEDRFGNWIAYDYDSVNLRQLNSVRSSEGARIDLTYVGGKITAVQYGVQTWQYLYANPERTILSAVVLPDNSRWSFQYGDMGWLTQQLKLNWVDCNPINPPGTRTEAVTITHPSGATGSFTFQKQIHGTDDTPGGCYLPDPDKPTQVELTEIVMAYKVASLIRKEITGPGIAPKAWDYQYGHQWSWDESNSGAYCQTPESCNSTVETSVAGPDGNVTRYVFGNSWWKNAGQLLKVDILNGGGVKKGTTHTYMDSAACPRIGYDPYWRNNPMESEKLCPRKSTVIAQDGATFSSVTNSFDSAFLRPLSVTKASSLGYAKAEGVEYYDSINNWVLGQLSRSTVNGAEVARAEYDAATALPLRYYGFGKLVQSLTYYADSTVATVADGNNKATAFSGWKCGIPQSITHPDNNTDSAVVNGNCWVTAATDENGYVTGYGYDPMGRLSSIAPPEGNATTRVFTSVAAAEYGLPSGHWRLTETTGNAKKITYFDGQWRPVVSQAEDVGNPGGTMSWSATRYDVNGQVVFASYPRNPYVDGWLNFDDATLKGAHTSYDALGRVTRVEQDSELGAAVATTTEYLPGFQRRTTNPRGFVTTQRFEVYDAPSYDMPVSIDAPLGSKTLITRDMFGKPTSVTRTGPDY